jgi:diguanylate cyclase (GGDEF)-like protein
MSALSTIAVRTAGNRRFVLVFTALILGGFSCLSLLSYLRARDVMDRQITGSTLPLTSDAILSSLEHDLLQPVLASGLMARNTFVENTLLEGERDPDQLRRYLQRIQEKTGAVTTFLVSDLTGRYHHPSGVLKTIARQDPQDRWYYRFRESGQPIEVNIDRDTADLSRTTAFINVRLQSASGRLLAVTGLGLDVRDLQEQLQSYQRRYGAEILLVDRSGRVVLSSDQRRGSLVDIPGLGSAARRILEQPSTALRISDQGRDLYVRTNRIAEIGWTLVVLQRRTAEQSAFIDLLAQNLVAAVLISLIVLVLAQVTLVRDHRRLETLARTDKLSGLLNRSVFDPLFDQLSGQLRRSGAPLAVAIIDLDHFKQVNDTHGHGVGDALIRHVSQRIVSLVRSADPLFRWGGEEFLLLMPGCDLIEARARLEGIREDIRCHPLDMAVAVDDPSDRRHGMEDRDRLLAVTMSIGLTLHHPGEPTTALLQRADDALYAAKRDGRDRLCCIETGGTPVAT